MPKLTEINTKRKALKGKVEDIHFNVPKSLLDEMDRLYDDVYSYCKKKLTRAFLFREGSRLLMRQFRAELKKAKRGEFHAKRR